MAASTTQNLASRSDAKPAKKKNKAAKSESASATGMATTPTTEVPQANVSAETGSGDGSYESPYIKELYKLVTPFLRIDCHTVQMLFSEQWRVPSES